MIKKFLFISIVLLTISCTCSKKTIDAGTKTKLDKIEEMAISKYSKKYTLKLNPTNNYALVYQARKIRKNDPFPTIFFSVYNVDTNKAIYEDVVPGGQIKWVSDYVIEVKSLIKKPKDIHKGTDLVLYKFNVKSHNRFK